MTALVATRWVVIAEEDILPATTGGRAEVDGFVLAARDAGVTMLLLVPGRDCDPAPYRARYPGVDVMHLPRDERAVLQLRRTPYVVASRPPTAAADAAVRAFRPDAVVALSVRSAALGLRWAAATGAPLVLRCVNRDSAYFHDLAVSSRGLRSLAYRVEARRMRSFERDLDTGGRVHLFADISDREAASHATRTKTKVIHVPALMPVPAAAGMAAVPTTTGTASKRGRVAGRVVVTASLDVEINQLAIEWLTTEVWPAVLTAVPHARLQVVGRAPGARVRHAVAGASHVDLHADVPEVESYLAEASVAVNPARTGTGLNIKLLQSMLAGCPSVSTRVGASGLDWVAGEHLLVADDAAGFARDVIRLLVDPELARRIGAAGAEWAARRMDPRPYLEAINAAIGIPQG